MQTGGGVNPLSVTKTGDSLKKRTIQTVLTRKNVYFKRIVFYFGVSSKIDLVLDHSKSMDMHIEGQNSLFLLTPKEADEHKEEMRKNTV